MLTLCFHGGEKITAEAAPVPVPGPGEVLIRTVVTVVCGSEMGRYHQGCPTGNPGHEGAGVVAALGSGVTGLAVGDRVGVCTVAPCDDPACPFCARGRFTWCPNRKYYGDMHAEYFLSSARACHKFPDDLDWETGVLISGDGFGVPYHSSQKFIAPETATVAIFGAGPIGLGNVIMQKFLGRSVFVSDISPARRKLSLDFGADAAFDPREVDAAAAIRDATKGCGADVCIECAGRPETARSCFAAVRTGGQVIFNGEQGEVALSISEDFIRRDITATGAWFYHFSEFPEMLRLWRSGLEVKKLLTHRYDCRDAATAYAEFAAGRTGKVLLEFSRTGRG